MHVDVGLLALADACDTIAGLHLSAYVGLPQGAMRRRRLVTPAARMPGASQCEPTRRFVPKQFRAHAAFQVEV